MSHSDPHPHPSTRVLLHSSHPRDSTTVILLCQGSNVTFASLGWTTVGWGYWEAATNNTTAQTTYAVAPGVDRAKWISPYGQRMTHVSDRWARNRTDALHYCYFNAAGYVAWENVWGTWNQVVPRDAEALRRVAHILRFLSRHRLTVGYQVWEPHYPTLLPGEVSLSLSLCVCVCVRARVHERVSE